MIFRRTIALARVTAMLFSLAAPALAQSTINGGIPTPNSPLQSSQLRDEFTRAKTDINQLFGQSAGTTAPSSPSIGRIWRNTGSNPNITSVWNGSAWVEYGRLDTASPDFIPYLGSFTNHGVMIGAPVGSHLRSTAAASDAQLLFGQTGADPLWRAITGDCTFTSLGVSNCSSIGGVTIFTPAQFSAVGNGIADDTTAWTNLCNAVQAAGSGIVLVPPGKNYLIYNSGQQITAAMCNFSGVVGLSIDMNGSKFTVGRVFVPNENVITVTGAAAGAGGVVQLTVNSSVGLYTGDAITVASVGGTTEAIGTWTVTVNDATHISLQGSTFVHAYTSGGTVGAVSQSLFLAQFNNSNKVYIKDWQFQQAAPIPLPKVLQQGAIGLALKGSGGDYTLINPGAYGGQMPVFCQGNNTDPMSSSIQRVTILGGSSTASYYGLVFGNNCNTVTVRDFHTDTVERSYFAYGVTDHDVSISSRNSFANDLLIGSSSPATAVLGTASGTGGAVRLQVASTSFMTTGDTMLVSGVGGTTEANGTWLITVNDSTHVTLTGTTFVNPWTSGGIATDLTVRRGTTNIRLNYQVKARNSGTQGVSYLTFQMIGNAGEANALISDIRANIDMDYSGETSFSSVSPAVQVSKSTTASLGGTLSNVSITGSIRNVPNQSGNLIDIGRSADAPWSGETIRGFGFSNFVTDGSTTPVFRIDYAPFTDGIGTFFCDKVMFAGSFTEVNSGTAAVKRVGYGCAFNANNIVLGPSWGGTGLFQPNAHSLLIGAGSSPLTLMTPLTDGQLVVGVTGADPAPRTPSQDVTLANTGAFTVLGASTTFKLSGTLTPTALAADQNDYNPSGLSTSAALRIDGGVSDRNITGLSGGVDGRLIEVINIGATNALVLKDQNGSSSAANRILNGADVSIGPNKAAVLRYDGTSSRWRAFDRALVNTGVTAGTYGSSSQVGQFTVDVQGRLSAAANVTVTPAAIGAAPTSRLINTTAPITGGGDLSADRTIGCAAGTTVAPGCLQPDGTTVTVAGGVISAVTMPAPQGRLTLNSSACTMTTNYAAQTSLYYKPCVGNLVPLYNGTVTVPTVFSTLTMAMGSNWAANALYDVYVGSDSGTVRLCTGAAWTNTSTRSETHTQINGFLNNAASMTCRYNNTTTFTCAINKCTYVGTIAISSAAGQINWNFGAISSGGTAGDFNVWNMYNRVPVHTLAADSTNQWNNTASAAWEAANLSTTMRVYSVRGYDEDGVRGSYNGLCANSSDIGVVGIALDATNTFNGTTGFLKLQTNPFSVMALYSGLMGTGRHFLQAVQWSNSGTTTCFGDSNAPTFIQSGLQVDLWQ